MSPSGLVLAGRHEPRPFTTDPAARKPARYPPRWRGTPPAAQTPARSSPTGRGSPLLTTIARPWTCPCGGARQRWRGGIVDVRWRRSGRRRRRAAQAAAAGMPSTRSITACPGAPNDVRRTVVTRNSGESAASARKFGAAFVRSSRRVRGGTAVGTESGDGAPEAAMRGRRRTPGPHTCLGAACSRRRVPLNLRHRSQRRGR